VLAPLLLFINPYYLGHIPANPKDVPFSMLYVLCLLLIAKLNVKKIPHAIILGVFMSLLVGMRLVGGFLYVVLLIKCMCDRKGILRFLLILAISAATLFAIWPFLWSDPLNKILSLITSAQDFSFWDRKILFNGQLITKDGRPWYYLFTYIFYKTPLLILFGAVGSVFIAGKKARFVAVVLITNLLLYLVLRPTIYNEMRHFLYLVPLITILASFFLIHLLESKNAVVTRFTACCILVSLLKMSYDFAILHPYQYVYFNEVAGNMSKIYKKYETDYWSASYKDSSRYLREISLKGSEPIKVYPCNLAFGVDYYSYKDFVLVNKSAEADYIICDYQNALINNFDLEDKIVFKVVRKDAVLSYVAKKTK